MYKPQVLYTPQIYKNFQTRFGGYNHTSSCGEGEIYDMKNIGHEEFPVLTPRRGRNTAPAFDNGRIFPAYSETEIVRPKILDIYSFDNAIVTERYNRIENGNLVEYGNICFYMKQENTLAYELKNLGNNYCIADDQGGNTTDFAYLSGTASWSKIGGARILGVAQTALIKIKGIVKSADDLNNVSKSVGDVFVETGEWSLGENEAIETLPSIKSTSYLLWRWDGQTWEQLPSRGGGMQLGYRNVIFKDGTYQGEAAEANTMYREDGFPDWIQIGDGIKIENCNVIKDNNKTVVVREISDDRTELRFYENTFTLNNGAAVTEDQIYIYIDYPVLDYMCQCNNRLFGCKGDTIYASKLGDPYNWNVFDGVSTDSYSVEVGSYGDFTACYAYEGDVLFFKEGIIYKLMYTDSSPENWVLTEIKTYGVKAGCHKSLAIADSCLFWYSPKGFMRYTGSLPMSINEAFGTQEFVNAVAGSDGKDYYVCLTDKAGVSALFVYDTTHYIWFKHDDIKITSFAYHKGDLTALVEKVNGNTEVIRIGQKTVEVPIAGEWFDMESMIEFGDVMNDTTNKKQKLNISVTAEVEAKSELRFYLSCDGMPYEYLGEIKGESKKQTHKFSYVPTRCDYYRLKVEGKGLWKIYAISNGYVPGSDI